MTQSLSEQKQNRFSLRNTNSSLQTRLVVFVLLTALIPLIFISSLNINQTQQGLTNAAEVSLKSGAQQTANSLDAFITTTLDSIRVESQFKDFSVFLNLSPELRLSSTRQIRARDLLNKLSQKDPANILSYALIDFHGIVLIDTLEKNIKSNESGDEYFKKARISDKPFVTSVTYFDEKTAIIVFAKSINDSNGKFVGILRATYLSSVLQQVISNSAGNAPDVSLILLDQLNIRMADTRNPNLILKSIVPLTTVDYSTAVDSRRFLNIPKEDQSTNLPEFAAALKNANEKPFFTTKINPDSSGTDSIAIAYLKTQPWSVAYSRPTSVFLADAQRQILNNILLVIAVSILVTIFAVLATRSLSNPIIALAQIADSISQGDINARATVDTTDEIGQLAQAFNSMTDRLQFTLVDLERRVELRTADLLKKNLEMETIADVAREISIIRDLDTLLKISVDLIRERFLYYHVGIYLIDERGEYAVLRAAKSVAAEELLAKNYKLKVGQTGLVGNVTRTGQAYIAQDVTKDTVHFENPLLPETKSEIVLPLRTRNITIGALDIHANTHTAFDEKDIQILQILADQLTAAIENAQLTQQIEGNLTALTLANRFQTQQIWRTSIEQQTRPAYEYNGMQIKAIPQNLPAALLKQLEAGKAIVINQAEQKENGENKSKNTLLIPLSILSQVIGVIGLEQEDPNHIWTEEEISIAQAAANRAALTLDNARLLEESQRRAVKERTIFESTARIGTALNIENILKATTEELEKVIGDSDVVLQFQLDFDQKS